MRQDVTIIGDEEGVTMDTQLEEQNSRKPLISPYCYDINDITRCVTVTHTLLFKKMCSINIKITNTAQHCRSYIQTVRMKTP